ncbi:MAG: Modulator of FtsH protease HflK [Verrucomicrobiota bacterium]|jgi:membrane protease subunit HflK
MSHDHHHHEEERKPSTAPAPTTTQQPAPSPEPHHHAVEDAGAQALSDALRSSFSIVRFLMFILLAAFVLSGLFTVAPNQVAILLRFGSPVGIGEDQLLQPGLHWKLPYPIDEVVYVPVGETKTITSSAGFYAMSPEEELAGGKDPAMATPFLAAGVDGYTLAGDGNIVHVRITVNYRITDPIRFAFGFENSTNLLQHLLDNATFNAAARFSADDALYLRRAAFREAVINRLTDLVNAPDFSLGIELDPREVRVEPPLFVQGAFNEVLVAQQQRDIQIREAETYARSATNKAIGEASVVVRNSLTLSNTLVQAVATDATNFLGLLPSYEKNPNLLKERLLAERVERVMTNAQFKAYLPARKDGRPRELRLQLNKEVDPPKKLQAGQNN